MRMQYRTLDNGAWQLLHPAFGWIDERKITPDSRPWRPFEQVTPRNPADAAYAYEFADGETFWANSHYLVFRREFHTDGTIICIHLSLRTVENDTRHDWRDFQRVKNELCGEDWEAIELYPAESRVVDTANQFHLWCYPYTLPIGFPVGARVGADEAARVGATQRPEARRGAPRPGSIITGGRLVDLESSR
jgi:hypothetical protein